MRYLKGFHCHMKSCLSYTLHTCSNKVDGPVNNSKLEIIVTKHQQKMGDLLFSKIRKLSHQQFPW